MFADKIAIAMVAVTDMAAAVQFYEGTLGFVPIARQGKHLITYRSGTSSFNVYVSSFAGTNQATAIAWDVGRDFDAVLQALQAKAVAFEHYDDLPDTTREGDVHLGGGMKVAWFKDPAGNLLNIVGR